MHKSLDLEFTDHLLKTPPNFQAQLSWCRGAFDLEGRTF